MNRRHFLASSSAAMLASCASLTSRHSGFIDAHVHVWTPDTVRYPLAPGFTKEGMKPASFTPEQLFSHCKPEGVDRIVLIQMSYYGTDNSYMLDMIAKHPGVFRGVAIVDPRRMDLPSHLRALKHGGVRGLRISPGKESPEAWVGNTAMASLWRHAGGQGIAICPLINPEVLPLLDKMCERFPDTTVVIDHFARVGMSGAIREKQLHDLCKLARHEHTFVKTSAFYALGEKTPPYLDLGPMIRRVRDAYGAKRLMWASDCPFQVDPGHNYHDSIALIRDRLDFLTQEEKDWMLRGTAAKVFFA